MPVKNRHNRRLLYPFTPKDRNRRYFRYRRAETGRKKRKGTLLDCALARPKVSMPAESLAELRKSRCSLRLDASDAKDGEADIPLHELPVNSSSSPASTPPRSVSPGTASCANGSSSPPAHASTGTAPMRTRTENSRNNSERMRVLVRVKPCENPNKRIVASDESCSGVTIEGREPQSFRTFDRVLGPECSQSELFTEVGLPAVDNAIRGINGTVCVYGQTGSGKTYSMVHPPHLPAHEQEMEHLGLAPRMLHELLQRTKEFATFAPYDADDSSIINASLHVSCVQLYQEVVTDLLDPSKEPLTIRSDKTRGMHCTGADEWHINSECDVMDVIRTVQRNRHIGETMANHLSSRSHVIITAYVRLRWSNNSNTRTRQSKLHLVDLAGSERQKQTQATGSRLQESAKINRSLSALTNVILALAKSESGAKRHIPYRDSKLTFLLSDSIGAGSRTTMVSCISSELCDRDETLSTLRLALRARAVRSNAVVSENVEASGSSIAERCARAERQLAEALQREQQLKEQLQNMQTEEPESFLPAHTKAHEAGILDDGLESPTTATPSAAGDGAPGAESNVSPCLSDATGAPAETAEASTQDNGLENEIDTVTQHLEHAVEQNEGLQTQIDAAEKRIQELSQKAQVCDVSVNTDSENVQMYDQAVQLDECAEWEKQVLQMQEQLRSEGALRLNAEQDSHEVQTLRSELSRMHERLQEMEVERDTAKQQFKQLKEEQSYSIEKQQANQAEKASLRTECESLRAENENLQKQVEQQKEEQTNLHRSLESLQMKVQEAEQSRALVQDSLQREHEKKQTVEIERDNLQDSLNSERGKKKSLEQEREHLKRDLSSLQQTATELQHTRQRAEDLERERRRLGSKLELCEDDSKRLSAAEARAQSAEAAVEQLQHEKRELQESLDTMQNELSVTRSDAIDNAEAVVRCNIAPDFCCMICLKCEKSAISCNCTAGTS